MVRLRGTERPPGIRWMNRRDLDEVLEIDKADDAVGVLVRKRKRKHKC